MRPYPWHQRKRFTSHTQLGWALHYAILPLTLVSILAFPPAPLVRLWAARRFHTLNDRWSKRGLVTILAGVVLMPVLDGGPRSVGQAFMDLMYSFGSKATMPVGDAVQQWFTVAAPLGLILVGIAALIHSYEYEFGAQRFLNPTRPTLLMRLRRLRHVRALRRGAAKPVDFIKFGVIDDDPIPWRTPRYGMVVERPVRGLGHGCITGANGSGKTILASNMAYDAAVAGQAVVYIDCKASLKTLNAIRAIADHAQVPFTSFDVGLSADASQWYDPLDYNGSASEKSSMLIEAFDLPSEGPSAFYRSAAEAWLPLQFEVMERIGLAPGEGRFDFLVTTSTPQGLKDRLASARTGDPAWDGQIDEWIRHTQGVKGDTLTNLKNNLTKIVTTGGDRLRPPADGSAPLSFAAVAEHGGIAYIGLSAATDATALKVLGSLAIRDLTALSGIRARNLPADARRVLSLVDEASRLGSRATVLEDLFATARESLIDVWPITQSFSTWPDSTRKEMVTNASTQVAFRVQDRETAESLTSSLGDTPALSEMTQENIEHRAFRDQSVSAEGDGRSQLVYEPHLRPDALLNVEDRHAYVWFSGTRTFATRRKWKSHRVRKDVIKRDAPLVKVVPVDIVLPENSAAAATAVAAAPEGVAYPYATHDFTELVAGFQPGAVEPVDPLRPHGPEAGPEPVPASAPGHVSPVPGPGGSGWGDTEHLPEPSDPVPASSARVADGEVVADSGWDDDAAPTSPWSITDGAGGATPPPLSDQDFQRIQEFKAHAAPAQSDSAPEGAPPSRAEQSPPQPPSTGGPLPSAGSKSSAAGGGWGSTDYLAPEEPDAGDGGDGGPWGPGPMQGDGSAREAASSETPAAPDNDGALPDAPPPVELAQPVEPVVIDEDDWDDDPQESVAPAPVAADPSNDPEPTAVPLPRPTPRDDSSAPLIVEDTDPDDLPAWAVPAASSVDGDAVTSAAQAPVEGSDHTGSRPQGQGPQPGSVSDAGDGGDSTDDEWA